jgi:hypothetical protein
MSDIKKNVRLVIGEVHYKVVEFEHVKPGKGAAFVRMKIKSFLNGKVVGYHSARRVPTPGAISIVEPLYKQLLSAERSGGISASQKILDELLKEKGMEYDEFILSI